MATILILDDDEPIVVFLSEILLAVGHLVISANTAARAREVLGSERNISLLILDHHLEGESGLQLLTELRQSARFRSLPVIVCSGDAKPESVKGFLSLQIASFIVKPFTAQRILGEIEHVLLCSGNSN